MLLSVGDIFTNLISYVNLLFQNELIIYTVAFAIVAGLIGIFTRLLRLRY